MKLVLDAAGYKREAEAAAVATDHLDNRVEAVGKDLKKLPRDAAEAAVAMKLVGDSASRQLRDAGDKSGKSFLGGFFGNLKKDFESDFANVTKAFGGGGIGGFAKALLFTPQGLAVTATAATALGTMIGGALVTGIGLGGIGAGVALQLHDPRVQAALATFKTDISSGLHDASASFAGPLREGIGILDAGFKKDLPGIKETFKVLAPEVTALAHGVSGFLSGTVTGLEHVAIASRPLVNDFSRWLPTFGNQLGGVFDQMAAHSKEALQGLHMLEDTISGLTIAGGKLIPVFSTISNIQHEMSGIGTAERIFGVKEADLHTAGFAQFGQTAVDALTRAYEANKLLNNSLGIQVDYWEKVQKAAGDTAAAFDKVFGVSVGVRQASDALNNSILQLSDSVEKHGKDWRDNTDAGLKNRSMVDAEEKAILALRDANVAAGMAADDANAQYLAQVQALRQALTAAGATTAQVDALTGSLLSVPAKTDVKVNTPGLGSASAGVADLNYQLGLLHDRQVSITTRYNYVFSNPNSRAPGSAQRYGGIHEHAETGLLNAGIYSSMSPARYAFAEPATGGEGFVPRFGDYRRSTGIIDQEARWYGGRFAPNGSGGGALRVELRFSGGDDALTSLLMKMHRIGDLQLTATRV